ncbi:hypothetical protein GGR57DRAFT_470485, partial [Xylariaceae sp. FL1272]
MEWTLNCEENGYLLSPVGLRMCSRPESIYLDLLSKTRKNRLLLMCAGSRVLKNERMRPLSADEEEGYVVVMFTGEQCRDSVEGYEWKFLEAVRKMNRYVCFSFRDKQSFIHGEKREYWTGVFLYKESVWDVLRELISGEAFRDCFVEVISGEELDIWIGSRPYL